MATLMQASRQWANRPEDERYSADPDGSLTTYRNALARNKASARNAKIPFADLRVIADGDTLALAGKTGTQAALTHYSFGQIAAFGSSPADYLRTLPTALAADCLNAKLAVRDSPNDAKLLFAAQDDGSLLTRSVNSELYDRVWGVDLVDGLSGLLGSGFRVAPCRPAHPNQRGTRPATEADLLPNQGDYGLSVKVGDPIAPGGLYASDRDMFAFVVNPDRCVSVGNRYLMRGVFISNSEVGNGPLAFTYFLFDGICGNHIVHGVENVAEVRVRHRAGRNAQNMGMTLQRAMDRFQVEIAAFNTSGAADTEARIKQAQSYEIAATKEDVIATCFKYAKVHGLNALSKARLTEGYELAEKHVDWYGSPRSAFGMVSGLTEGSQLTGYMDTRTTIDAQASKLMEIAF